MPVQLIVAHWSLLVVDLKHRQFHHFDSMRTHEASQLAFELGRKLLEEEEKFESGDLDLSSWEERVDERFPQQAKDCDGGIFAAQAIRHLYQSKVLPSDLSQQSWPFSPESADALRWHMWKEISAKSIAPLPA